MKEAKQRKPGYVSIGQLLAWNTRPIALGAVTIIIGYFSIYCTDTLGMDPALVGTILLFSKVFDGVTDLVAGWLIDNTRTKWGKARPYELCIIGVWVCTWALFAAPVAWSTMAKSIWIFIMYTLVFSIFSTLLNAAESPYIISAFGDPVAITKVSAYGGIVVTLGGMVVSITFPIAMVSMATSAEGWRKMLMMYAIPLVLVGLIRFIFVKEKAETDTKEEHVSLKQILEVLKSNKYVWLLAIASAVPQMITSMAAASYYFTYVVGDIAKYGSVQMFGMISMIVMVVFPALMKKFSAMQLVGAFSVLGLVGYVLNFFAGGNMTLLIIGFLISGVALLPTAYMRSPIIMQISDYNESKNLPRMEGTLASATNFVCKIATGIGSFMIGMILKMGGYDGSLAVQSDSAVFMIRILYSLIPAALMIPVVFCAIGFRPLDKMQKSDSQS